MAQFRLITLFLLTLTVVCFNNVNAVPFTLLNLQQAKQKGQYRPQTTAIVPEHIPFSNQYLNLERLYPESVRATPNVQIHYHHYSIQGNTANDLREQMSQSGPLDLSLGRRYDARTDWSVQWFFSVAQEGDHCAMKTASSRVVVTMTLPQWKISDEAPRALLNKWQTYLTALQLHETHHQENGIAAAREILEKLIHFSNYPSCDRLEAAANSTAQNIIKYFNQQDTIYDLTTKHGYSQGAVFPPILTTETTALQ